MDLKTLCVRSLHVLYVCGGFLWLPPTIQTSRVIGDPLSIGVNVSKNSCFVHTS